MPRQRDAVPYLCFAPEGEPHGDYRNEPFSNDAIHCNNGQSRIWIGYRNDLDASYNGGMTLNQVLAQARDNLSKAMEAPGKSTKRAQWREAFPGFATKASSDVLQQLKLGKRALKPATCPSNTCKAGPELKLEWISIKSSTTKTEVFLIGYVFQLQGHEMISICRNYSSSLYRFQRTDGSVCLDMFIRIVHSELTIRTGVKPSSSPKKGVKRRRSGRYHVPDILNDNDPIDDSSLDELSTTIAHATDGSLAHSSSGVSTDEPRQDLEDEPMTEPVNEHRDEPMDEKGEVTPPLATVSPLSTMEEYAEMIGQICHTYGVRVLKRPDLTTQINNLEQAVRDDNRFALCRSFARIKTMLVVSAAHAGFDFMDEEYEAMVSSTVAEFGMDLLNSTEGVMFMENMGKAMVAGQRERLGTAYANLRAYMVAYSGHAGN